MSEKKIGNLVVGLGVFIFGINFVSMKFLIKHIPPFTLIFLRFAIASVFLGFIVKIKSFKSEGYKKIHRDDKISVIVTGFLGVAIFYSLYGLALVYISASLGALICAMIPIFTLIANIIIYKKKFDPFVIVNFIIAVLGVLLVLDIGLEKKFDFSKLIGCIFMLLAIFSWIAYTIKTYELQRKYDSIYLLYKQTLSATALLLVVALFDCEKAIKVFEQRDILVPLIGNLLFVGIICSALGYFFYIYGMEKIGVEISSLYMNLIPAVTAIASYLFLNEIMNIKKVIGIIIVIGSLFAVGLRDWIKSRVKEDI
ncbi:MAG: DMT family transporter [Anaeromicrobium sp.]|jgi:drug/metabolite transporter (DMT)-like permease|uniref:DMT family transporter n=1 Tax=Anaeromicrobium sp. TaxID=1929132 RepID=UPI0025F4FCED|nr:DMT family transporter [Anaeromicrobium sp.]MCT4595309.1 DMT family transporter [Anaeromicrobium sp.]